MDNNKKDNLHKTSQNCVDVNVDFQEQLLEELKEFISKY